ncbi:MAG: hypothetical protein CMM55_08880 [Rhodospirillaceae bacterium]|nr:hypothetical protein [Rhodospirillaceae bacterium]|tara:strand:- start:489 stop:1100 length:612 start_codon:yes stop_codon:yes gene_type:complete
MGAILENLTRTIVAGFVLAVLLFLMYMGYGDMEGTAFWKYLWRIAHVLSGVMWIGILWYFNFVQIPNMGKIPDEQKPAIGKVIAPAALFWFRWGAMLTIITGLGLAMANGYIVEAISLGLAGTEPDNGHRMIGIGMWLGAVMWFNVWFIIWPNQKRALGIVDADADSKAASARTAMLFSRTNTLLSIPMLFAMVAAQNLYSVS